MIGSDGGWPRLVRQAATLLANRNRAVAPCVDERWRRNNQALRAQRGLPPDSRRDVARTAAAALLGLVLIAVAAVASAALVPVATGQAFVLDEAGSVLDRGSNRADQGHRPRSTAASPSRLVWEHG